MLASPTSRRLAERCQPLVRHASTGRFAAGPFLDRRRVRIGIAAAMMGGCRDDPTAVPVNIP